MGVYRRWGNAVLYGCHRRPVYHRLSNRSGPNDRGPRGVFKRGLMHLRMFQIFPLPRAKQHKRRWGRWKTLS